MPSEKYMENEIKKSRVACPLGQSLGYLEKSDFLFKIKA